VAIRRIFALQSQCFPGKLCPRIPAWDRCSSSKGGYRSSLHCFAVSSLCRTCSSRSLFNHALDSSSFLCNTSFLLCLEATLCSASQARSCISITPTTNTNTNPVTHQLTASFLSHSFVPCYAYTITTCVPLSCKRKYDTRTQRRLSTVSMPSPHQPLLCSSTNPVPTLLFLSTLLKSHFPFALRCPLSC